MSPAPADITVLIPTRAAAERRSSLRQAIESVLCQEDVQARAIILVNGAQAEPDLPLALSEDPRVTLLRRTMADLPAAFQEGARAVETPDRKSTRLNSSHVKISYAVSCL